MHLGLITQNLLILFYFQNIIHEKDGGNISVPHTRPETPRSVTHTHDEDYSDEDSDEKTKPQP